MGLAWQQGPLATRAVGHFLVANPLPERLLFAEPLRRRMRVRFGGEWVVDSEDVILLHEPDRYPVAFFPLDHVRKGVLVPEARTTRHRELGPTAWFSVRGGGKEAQRAAYRPRARPQRGAPAQRRRRPLRGRCSYRHGVATVRAYKSMTTSPTGCEQQTRRLPSAGLSSGSGP